MEPTEKHRYFYDRQWDGGISRSPKWAKVQLLNCKGAKATVHEGGTRCSPQSKGKLKEGVDIDALTAHIDFYRTICQLAQLGSQE